MLKTNIGLKRNKPLIPFFSAVVLLAFLLGAFIEIAYAGVLIFDNAAPLNRPVKLRAFTSGRFFPEGGRLVEFYVNYEHIGSALSGGDGNAFFKYVPSSSGISVLTVNSDNETGEGTLLITDSKDRVILIAIENTLFKSIFSLKPSKEGRDALKQLSKNYRIIYLTAILGVKESRKWLKDNEFPVSAVLKWEGPELIAELKEREINPYAIIAPPEILSEAPDIKKRYSFVEAEDVMEVKDWDDLLKQFE
jgi:hypothetical protein